MVSDTQIPYKYEDWLHEAPDCSIQMSKAIDKGKVPEYLAQKQADMLAEKMRG